MGGYWTTEDEEVLPRHERRQHQQDCCILEM